MKMLVRKHPELLTHYQANEVPDDFGPVPAGAELMSREEFEAWKASLPAVPGLDAPPSASCTISRDDLFRRVRAAGKLAELTQLIEALPATDRLEITMLDRLNVDDPRLRAAVQQLGLDPEQILAP